MSSKSKSRFTIKKVYIITFAIITVLSTIALAGYSTNTPPPVSWTRTIMPILSGEAIPAKDRTIAISRWEKVHNFVNYWQRYWSNWLNLDHSLAVSKNVRVWFEDPALNSLYVYWDLQLSTADVFTSSLNTWNCNTGNVWRIRLRMPGTAGTVVCPLMICYPWNQTWSTNWVSRKSACDPVTFPTTPSRNQVWIMTWTLATD